MRIHRRSLYLLLSLATAVAAGISSVPAPLAAQTNGLLVADIRVGAHKDKTRLVLDLTGPARYEWGLSPTGDSLFIDLPGAQWASAAFSARHSQGLIVEFKPEMTQSGMSLSVLTDGPIAVKKPFLLSPSGGAGHRLVFDLVRVASPMIADVLPAQIQQSQYPQRRPEIVEVASANGGYSPPPSAYYPQQSAQVQQPGGRPIPPQSFPQTPPPERSSFLGFNNLYLKGTAGMSVVSNIDTEGSGNDASIESDFGWTIGGAVGIDMENNFRLEGEMFYLQNSVNSVVGSLGSTSISTGNVEGDVNALAFMANVAYDVPNQSRFTPFVFGGLGIANVGLGDVSSGGTTLVDDSTWVFGMQGGAGISTALDERIQLEAYYRYFETVAPEFSDRNGQPFEAEFVSHSFVAGVRIDF